MNKKLLAKIRRDAEKAARSMGVDLKHPAVTEGRAAFEKRKPVTSCKYKAGTDERRLWEFGWWKAWQDDLLGRKK